MFIAITYTHLVIYWITGIIKYWSVEKLGISLTAGNLCVSGMVGAGNTVMIKIERSILSQKLTSVGEYK